MFVEAHSRRERLNDAARCSRAYKPEHRILLSYWLGLRPFLTSYRTERSDPSCSSIGTSEEWWAARGASDGVQRWSIDLVSWAGRDVEFAITYASDDFMQHNGVFISVPGCRWDRG